MASENKLLGSSGKEIQDRMNPSKVQETASSSRVPVMMFHPTEVDHRGIPKGVKVTNEVELDNFIEAGYKDHPGKIKLIPVFKDVWEEEQKRIAEEEKNKKDNPFAGLTDDKDK